MRLSGADPAAVLKVREAAAPAVEAILRNADLTKASRAAALQQVSWAGGRCWLLDPAWLGFVEARRAQCPVMHASMPAWPPPTCQLI